jgi:hypothetical protein
MAEEIEISTLDLRYEDFRMKNASFERKLLASIGERGIEESLEGVDVAAGRILLNGFKRYRCAKKLGLGTVPYVSLGTDEALGILALLRVSNDRSLGILEQARFIDELRAVHRLSVAEMAGQLKRSKSWVRARIFSGAFPIYAYMYTLRQFMRMNKVPKGEIGTFVEAVSGRGLSVREIEYLAHGFFRGPESLRTEIRRGNLALPLERMRQVAQDPDGCSEPERLMLRDLEQLQKYMQRVMGRIQDPGLQGRAFQAQGHLLVTGILSRLKALAASLRGFHDRSGEV